MAQLGRGSGCIFTVPSVRVLRVPRQMERKITADGFSGKSIFQ